MDAAGRRRARRSRRPTPTRRRSASSRRRSRLADHARAPRAALQRQGRGVGRLRGRGQLRAHVGPVDAAVRRHPDRPQPVLRRPHHADRRAPARRRRPHPGLRGHQGHEPVHPQVDDLGARRRTWPWRAGTRPRRRCRTAACSSSPATTITLGPNPDPNTPVPLINSRTRCRRSTTRPRTRGRRCRRASRRMPLYPFMFVLPNGKLFDAGPDRVTRTLDLQTGQWTTVGTSPIDGQSAVMYRPGKILKSGTWSDPEFPGREATNRADGDRHDRRQPGVDRDVAPMKYRRSYHTLTVLPDGKVLATGGQNGTDGVDETTGVLPAEMWDPDTNTWTTMASTRRPRLYHSSALLLPDGRVLLAGGGAYGNCQEREERRALLPAVPVQGPAADRHRRAGPASTTASRSRSTRPTRAGSTKVSLRPHGLGDAQRRHGPALHEPVDDGRLGLRSRSTARRTPTSRRPAATWSSWSTTRACRRWARSSSSTPDGDTQPPTAPANARRDRAARRRRPQLDGLDRQQGGQRVPRLPLDDVRLHPERRPTASRA